MNDDGKTTANIALEELKRWNKDTVLIEGHTCDVGTSDYNLALGAGLSEVAGKVFRIGHLGDLNELMLLGAIGGAEMAMLDNGIKIQPGSGVAAAQAVYRANPLLKM